MLCAGTRRCALSWAAPSRLSISAALDEHCVSNIAHACLCFLGALRFESKCSISAVHRRGALRLQGSHR